MYPRKNWNPYSLKLFKMIRLLKIEWAKLVTYKPFWLLSIFYLILAPLFMLFIEALNIPIFTIGASEAIYGFPSGWQFMTYMSSWLHILLGIIIVIFATNEFNHRTARQHIIDGLTRNELFLSKLTLTAFLSIIATLYTGILAIIGSLVYTGGIDNFFDGMEYIPIFLFQTFGYLSIALMFSFIVRSSGYAILIFLGVLFVEAILRSVLAYYFSEWFAVFAPIGMISQLTPIPFIEEVIRNKEDLKYVLSLSERFVYGTLYILGYIAITYRLIRKRDF